MSKIVKNTTNQTLLVADTGVSISANGQYTIDPQTYWLWAASDNIITYIGNGSAIINDGSADLGISDAVDLIKGLFPKSIVIQDENGDKATVTNNKLDVNATFTGGEVEFPSRQQDSFGNNISVEPHIIFSTHFSNTDHSDSLWNKRETSGGTVTHSPSTSSVLLNVTTSSGSRAEYQTFRAIQYIPGQALEFMMTGVFDVPKTNQKQRLGLRTNNNNEGMYFEMDSTTLNVVLKGFSTTTVARSNWDDPMDGTGPSGINLDLDGGIGHIATIRYQWLGYGDVEFGFQVGRKFIVCHTIVNHNTLSQPYSKSPSFHGFAEIVNSGTVVSASTLRLGCFAAKSFGSAIYGSHTTSCSNRTTLISVGGSSYTPIIGVRLNDSISDNEAILEKINIFSSAATDIYYEILFNASITGGSWSSASEGVQQNTTISSYSGGHVIYSDYFDKKGSGNLSDITSFARLGRNIDGTSNTLLVIARSTGGNASVGASLILKEIH